MMLYSLVVVFGLLFAIRETKDLSLQRPATYFPRIWRQAMDLFLTMGLVIGYVIAAESFPHVRQIVQDHVLLIMGFLAYLFSKYQKKKEIFFLSSLVLSFLIYSDFKSMQESFFLAAKIAFGIALFQSCFLGMRHKLLFSEVPKPMRGWPILCLLASFISMSLWSVCRLLLF